MSIELVKYTENSRTSVEDNYLVEQLVVKNEEALVCLIDRYGPQVCGLCESILNDQLDAQSVMSDVFLELWNRPENFDPHRGSLKTYLMLMARSRSLDSLRSRKIRRKRECNGAFGTSEDAPAATTDASPIHLSVKTESCEKVTESLLALSQCQQDTLRLAFFSGLSHRQVAAQLEMPLGTVKTHIRKGLLRLKQMLSEFREAGEIQ
ncbi:MAG: sigma-70 family RNA polymerase sigma factor [Planctomycetales bacterium]|nr:sigma-70 family RNA polymerase sigma factor [Planctomycetales bacterium]